MITYLKNKLFFPGKTIELAYPIKQLEVLSGICFVLLDPDAFQEKFGQFPNLLAFDNNGRQLWVADLPTTQSGDRYYKISSKDPLIVYSIYSYECLINKLNGTIEKKIHFK